MSLEDGEGIWSTRDALRFAFAINARLTTALSNGFHIWGLKSGGKIFQGFALSTAEPVKHVLIVCTGNSCRSIMAEALINDLAGDRFHAVSAGSHPTGVVHPDAIRALQRANCDFELPRSKSLDEFMGQQFDYMITVCDNASEEVCPMVPPGWERLHWSTPDPACAEGSEGEISAVFDDVLDTLRQRVLKFVEHNELS